MKERCIDQWTKICESDLAHWKNVPDMINMFEQDFLDGLNVIEVAFDKGPEAAKTALWYMDTAPRDYVWECLEQHGYRLK